MCFIESSDDVYENYYCKNCIPLLRIGDNCFIDFEFENRSGIIVSSVEVSLDDNNGIAGLEGAKEKYDVIMNQEKKLEQFCDFLQNSSETEIGNGLPIFEKWEEIDTGKNSNYDQRVRELILHLFYYYENDFNQDLEPYRAKETSNEQRKDILKRIISRGSKNDISFYEYFNKNKDGIIYHLQGKIIERTENKENIKRNIAYEELDVNPNLIANPVRFHYYVPVDVEDKTSKNIIMKLKLYTVHGYTYEQSIDITVQNKLFNNIACIPDEVDISKKRKELDNYETYNERNEKLHIEQDLHLLIQQRAKIFIDSIRTSVRECR